MIDNDVQFEKNNIVFNYRIAIIIRKDDHSPNYLYSIDKN